MSGPPFGAWLPRVDVRPPGPRSLELAGRLRAVESRNVTYLDPDFPVFWRRAAGANVEDVDGNVFVDLTAAFGVAGAGHTHPAITEALHAQAERLVHGMGDVHPSEIKVQLLEALTRIAPWPDARAVLASTGAEAVEIALKTAEIGTGRSGLIAFEGGYHGLTLGALGATHRLHFRDPFARRIHDAVWFLPFPTTADEAVTVLDRLDALLEGEGRERIGALIVEPVQARAGVRVPAAGFLAAAAERVRVAGALVIFDEIFTGFGRTGRRFGFEWEGMIPDLFCAGKALGGGMPLSACLGSADTMAAWPESTGEAIHTSTFLGHPLTCAASLAFLRLFDRERLHELAETKGHRIATSLRDRLEASPSVREVRGRGLLQGIEISEAGRRDVGDGGALMVELMRRGFLTLAAGPRAEVLELSPPFTLTDAQWDAALDAIGRVFGVP